ncbi:hypothetical protein K438DRAFT_1762164 [Mycena galopus ATCC 62051]|nr:hypothetical protein K438DRAFT_1762164 [Mycena galopus ATCC 62051]
MYISIPRLRQVGDTKKPRILHSGQYWQNVRRRAKEAKATHAESTAPPLGNGSRIFVPGRYQPYTSTLHPSSKLVTLATPTQLGSSEQTQVTKLAALRKKRHKAAAEARDARARKLKQEVEDADAALLARFRGKQTTTLKKR